MKTLGNIVELGIYLICGYLIGVMSNEEMFVDFFLTNWHSALTYFWIFLGLPLFSMAVVLGVTVIFSLGFCLFYALITITIWILDFFSSFRKPRPPKDSLSSAQRRRYKL